MKIALYTADYWEHVCPIVRIVGPLREAGIPLVLGSYWEAGQIKFFPERATEADIVLIQRDFPRFRELYEQVIKIARDAGKPVIYDIDDDLLDLPSAHPDFERYRLARVAMLRAILEADMVTCPTLVLANVLKKFNNRVVVLPNYLNDNLWKEAVCRTNFEERENRYPLVIGYMGGRSHVADLDLVKVVLIEILRQYKDEIRMQFWGCPPPADLRGWKNVEWLDIGLVSYAEFAHYLSTQKCDIFIAPLVNSPFNRAKSPIKFLEYSILGIPGVYSYITPYESIIIHGETGFLAQDLAEWQYYLSQLIENPSLRWEMGTKARESVMSGWLLSGHAQKWREVYEQALASRDSDKTLSEAMIQVVNKLQAWADEDHNSLRESRENNSMIWLEIETLEKRLEERGRLVKEILASPGWRLVTLLGAVRARLAPQGSWRERLLWSGVSLLQRLMRVLKKPDRLDLNSSEEGSLAVTETSDRAITPPLISIVVESTLAGIDIASVQAWVKMQTYPAAEIVVWDKGNARAYLPGSPESWWIAPTIRSLTEGLIGRYICMASPNLIRETETCLETNLIALESEGLMITINWHGDLAEGRRWLRLGRIPMVSENPCLYIVRREALLEDFSVDLSRAGGGNQAVRVGKIITYPSNVYNGGYDSVSPGPIIRLRNGMSLYVEDHDIIVTPFSGESQESISRIMHPVNRVVPPIPPEGDDRPFVLVVMPFLAVGGAERVTIEIMYQLKKEIRFVIAASEKSAPFLGSMAGLFRQVTPYVFNVSEWISPQLRFSFFVYLIERFSPRTLYIANGSEWIYEMLSLIKQKYPGLRIVNQVYDHRVGWINRYDATLVASIDGHIGCNRKICDAYQQRGVSPKAIYPIEHGVDTNQFNPDHYSESRRSSIKERMGLPLGTKVVTFMGRLHPQKRPMDFVEVARRFARCHDVTFLIVGDGPLAGALDTAIQRIGSQNLIRRPFAQATDVFAITDVLVLPSEYEGMPMVVLEAQAMGKPVVATDVGNVREILAVTGGGVVCSIGDVQAIAEGVENMLRNPPDPTQIRQAVVQHFDIRRVATSYKQALLGG